MVSNPGLPVAIKAIPDHHAMLAGEQRMIQSFSFIGMVKLIHPFKNQGPAPTGQGQLLPFYTVSAGGSKH